MKLIFKLIKLLIVLVIIAVGILASLLLTKSGNKILQPYAQKYINQEISPHKLIFTSFELQSKDTHLGILIDDRYSINISGSYALLKKHIDFDYTAKDIQELTQLNISGTAKGTINLITDMNIDLKGKGTILQSPIQYRTIVKGSNTLANLDATIQNLNTKHILKFIDKPIYASSNINIDIKSKKLNFNKPMLTINSKINKLTPNHKLIAKDFNITLPKDIIVTGQTSHIIINKNITSAINLVSKLITIQSNQTKLNIDKLIADGDFDIQIPNLLELQPIINKKLYGQINANGTFEYDKTLKINGQSNVALSDTTFDLQNNELTLNSKNISTTKLLYTLGYPDMFTSTGELNLKYNIITGKGIYDFNLNNGHISKSNITDKVKAISGLDLTQIIYHEGNIEGNISKAIITVDGYMGGDTDRITLKDTNIYPHTQTLTSALWFKHKKEELKLKLSGNIKNPKIRVDFKEMLKGRLKTKAQTKVKNEAQRFLKKNIEKIKINDDVKNIVKDNLKNMDSSTVKGILDLF